MTLRHQRGVALVVALMITLIIGVIAVTLASVTTRSQKSDNANYGKTVGQANAVSGVNRAINFLSSTAQFEDRGLFLPTTVQSQGIDQAVVGGVNIATTDFFRGVVNVMGDSLLDTRGTGDRTPWYRVHDNWTREKCNRCVILNNGTTAYLIEYRGFRGQTGDPTSSAARIGYAFYRITSRGLDSVDNERSAAIVQTNVGIRRTLEEE